VPKLLLARGLARGRLPSCFSQGWRRQRQEEEEDQEEEEEDRRTVRQLRCGERRWRLQEREKERGREEGERSSRLSMGLRRPPRPHLVGLDRHRLPSLVRECEARRQGRGEREGERGEGDVQNNFLN
jgi:hypothetical protein